VDSVGRILWSHLDLVTDWNESQSPDPQLEGARRQTNETKFSTIISRRLDRTA